jgi:hypothetical protein
MVFFLVLLLMQSCVAVKEYDKLYINDPDEIGGQLRNDMNTFQVYRSAAGANGGKTGGGCGCN